MIGIFAAVGIAVIGLAHVACDTTVANSAKETGYEDASRGFWPDYSEYKILRYVVGSKGRADFREAESLQWGGLRDHFATYQKGNYDANNPCDLGFVKKPIGCRDEFVAVLISAGVGYTLSSDTVFDYCLIDLSTVKEVGQEKKYYK